MTTELKQIADEIIDLSIILDNKIESWDDVFARIPDSPNVNVTAGFITNWTIPNSIEVLVEVRASTDDTQALVRTQAIETIKHPKGYELFNQISLHYSVDYGQARQLVEKGGATTREDIAKLLHTGKLVSVVVSDETGKDNATEQLLGKRYDYDGDELATINKDTEHELTEAIDKVLTKLKLTAKREA